MTEQSQSAKWAWLMAAVIIARSTSYMFSKICLQSMEPFTLLAIRFLLTFALLAAVFGKRLRTVHRSTVISGAILGLLFFSVMAAELTGLRSTNSSTASLLENTSIIFVPLIESGLRKKAPPVSVLLFDLATILGISLLTFSDGGFTLRHGERLLLLAAVFYACTIVSTDRLSHREDPLALGILQVGFIGVFGLTAACLFESPRLPASGQEWGCLLFLVVVCSGFGFTLQPLAQSHTSSEKCALFCALNPLTAALLGVIFLGERFRLPGILGAGIILTSMLTFGRLPTTRQTAATPDASADTAVPLPAGREHPARTRLLSFPMRVRVGGSGAKT